MLIKGGGGVVTSKNFNIFNIYDADNGLNKNGLFHANMTERKDLTFFYLFCLKVQMLVKCCESNCFKIEIRTTGHQAIY